MTRFNRQEILPQIGPAGQGRLRASRLLVVGCGALGSAAAEMLVRSGIGFLRLVDRDLVELTNLQRQVLFDERDAAENLPKSVAAARRLREINSEVEIDAIVADANAANIESFADVDLILDGTDNISTRYLLNDLSVRNRIPWIYGGCVGTEGRVWGIWPGRTACLRCIFPEPPNANELPTCDTAGVLGPAAMVVGGFQAALAIRFLVEGESAPDKSAPDKSAPDKSSTDKSAGLVSFDVWTSRFHSLSSASIPADGCPCCQQRKFPFLSTNGMDFTTNLCGRQAVQVLRSGLAGPIDLAAIAERWQNLGTVGRSPWFVRCKLTDPSGIDLTLFSDGRLLVHGITDPMRATSLYARFVGN
jgi:molybdopterin-synthase adenylyltransferase